jgi:hypothetical protein
MAQPFVSPRWQRWEGISKSALYPCGQPDAPVYGFYLASVSAARRLPYALGIGRTTPGRPHLQPCST